MARTRAVVSDYDKRDGSKRPLERRIGIGSGRPSARGGRRGGVAASARSLPAIAGNLERLREVCPALNGFGNILGCPDSSGS